MNGRAGKARFGSRRGFTLFELLAVMAIIGLSLSLALPQMLATVEAVSVDAEHKTLKEMVDQIKLYAFLRQKSHLLEFENRSVYDESHSVIKEFDYLRFPKQTITWNIKGFPDTRRLEFKMRGQDQSLALY